MNNTYLTKENQKPISGNYKLDEDGVPYRVGIVAEPKKRQSAGSIKQSIIVAHEGQLHHFQLYNLAVSH